MKKLLHLKINLLLALVTILMVNSELLFGQSVGISATGTTPPNSSAGLDINFTDKGFLISRVALIATTNPSPLSAQIAGIIVYNTASTSDVTPGLYFNDGTKWVPIFVQNGTIKGQMQYWNGTAWVIIPAGLPGQKLKLNSSGIPEWNN